jgi:hypothetical protein
MAGHPAAGFLKQKTTNERKPTTMAIKLNATYSKKLGLPGYSSHQFSVSVETELTTTRDVPAESARLYQTLQQAVDTQMQQTGFVPDLEYGMNKDPDPAPVAPVSRPSQRRTNTNTGNGHPPENPAPAVRRGTTPANAANGNHGPAWKCSDKQRDFITSLVIEHDLDRHEIDDLARERFGAPVIGLNKLQASGLIDELIERTGGKARSNGNRRNGGGR